MLELLYLLLNLLLRVVDCGSELYTKLFAKYLYETKADVMNLF